MFRGIASASLDAKGRMPVPTLYREDIVGRAAGKVVVTIDLAENCLLLYSAPEWEQVQRRIDKLPNFGSKGRMLQRLFVGHATDLQLDGNGRILLPQMLRDHAGLSRKVVTVGQGNKIELWSEEVWNDGKEEWLSPAGRQALLDSDEFGSLQI